MTPVLLPDVIGGKYRPRNVLGAGSTGTVYSVEHTFTGEILALKLMRSYIGSSPDAIARFKREAHAVAKIRSEHVVRIFDADVASELGGVPYLVMDLLEGIDLEQLSSGRRIEPETVIEWLGQIASPLDKAHRVGIVHRDLKPENLFLTRRDDGSALIKILDFGIAKITFDAPSVTQSGLILGTPLYMAPEQARGDPAQVGPATDLYALGLTAYQLLTGTPYRTETSVTAVLSEIQKPTLRLPSELGHAFGPSFDQWFLRACHPEPAQRFASAEEQIQSLAAALGVPLEPESAFGPSSGSRTRESLVPARVSDPKRITPVGAVAGPGDDDKDGGAREEVRAMKSIHPLSAGHALAGGMSWRRLFSVCALVALPWAIFFVFRGRPAGGGAAPAISACATDSALPPVALAPKASPERLSKVVGVEEPVVTPPVLSSLPTPSIRTQISGSQSGPPRAAVRPISSRAASPRVRTITDDEALSDQQ